ncbi:hypothetical protein [Aquibacillus saliphilus]|uniref:hypothetical protein n=1 Tax=Aquibacillus saliphilus TaxID=1909422 RepID=UPI001CEFD7B3|nr:hypothetical protein [Aquibacillus saliphilus]
MIYREPELKEALNNFDNLLIEYHDNYCAVYPYKHFLENFVTVRTVFYKLPLSEIMAVIKHKKPNTYYLLKVNYSNNPTLHFISKTDMNYVIAQKRLTRIRMLIK